MKEEIRYLTISDLHLLSKGKTEVMVENLNHYFGYYDRNSRFADLDMIFIAGDVFDHLLDITTGELDIVTLFFKRLSRFCCDNNIILRILEGTPSHDWKQSKYFKTLYECFEYNGDFKYVESLSIEYIKSVNMYVLYVPDEWSNNSDDTFSEVLKIMRDMNIDKVDIAIMHGLFTYQLKGIGKESVKHKEENYLSIVRYYINIGHIHSYSFFSRIIAQGSFDRHSFGEEEEKGGVVNTINVVTNEISTTFIPNKKAMIYKDIVLKNNDVDKGYAEIKKVISDNIGNYRLVCKKDNPLSKHLKQLEIDFPECNFKCLITDNSNEVVIRKEIKNIFNSITITEENIISLICEELSHENISKDEIANEIKRYL